jgi:hypothetical protein
MWDAIVACVVCAVTLLAFYLILKNRGTWELVPVELTEDAGRVRVIPPKEVEKCQGEHHGPTSLGSIPHITCLFKMNGHLEMWCHTHEQWWDECIAAFTT